MNIKILAHINSVNTKNVSFFNLFPHPNITPTSHMQKSLQPSKKNAKAESIESDHRMCEYLVRGKDLNVTRRYARKCPTMHWGMPIGQGDINLG